MVLMLDISNYSYSISYHMVLTGAKRREWMGCWGLLG